MKELQAITLLNGMQLKCFPKKTAEKVQPIDNSLQLDMTGEYFQIGRQRGRKRKKPVPLEERPEVQVFLGNAHYLFDHCDDILSDSRMFLCPIPFHNELAYFGVSGFHHPILGVYIELWASCKDVRLLDENGGKWLVCQLSGSPLTHCNSCLLANPEGKTTRQHIGINFMDVCRKFVRINRRYDYAKLKYEAYSLEDVLKALKRKDRRRKIVCRMKELVTKCFPFRTSFK